ncbi:hypothetical protein TorRG33x02_133300 [Trema orientale]|uniref:Uncharacterized protein n=1 Tax=Trema orientale TaxID=63057 RepID=A0A2P5EZF6_TREOI|nr:hypothetical protein TorRG33x02_133300 [Trema orientale]
MVVLVIIVNASSLALSSILVMPQSVLVVFAIMNMAMFDISSVPSSIVKLKPYTFERNDASINKLSIIQVTHEATSRGSPKLNLWNPQLLSSLDRKAHNSIIKLITTSRGTCSSFNELSFKTSSLNGARQFFLVTSHKAGTSWVASQSEGSKPSVMVSNLKSFRPLTNSGPLDRINPLWLNSVLTKVIWKPLKCRSFGKFHHGVNVALGCIWDTNCMRFS